MLSVHVMSFSDLSEIRERLNSLKCSTYGSPCPELRMSNESSFQFLFVILHLQLSQLYPEENLEKFIPCLAGPDSFYLERNHMDLESDLRYAALLCFALLCFDP